MDDLQRYMLEVVKFKSKIGLKLPQDYNYIGGEDYVLDRGTPFTSEPLTPDEWTFVNAAIKAAPIKRWQLGECFFNAQMLAASDKTDRLRYVEGYAIGLAGIPVLHGWCVLDGKKVIDLTWRTVNKRHKVRLGDRIFGDIPEGFAYYGAEFASDAVRTRIIRLKAVASFIDDIEYSFPLFQEPRVRPLADILNGATNDRPA